MIESRRPGLGRHSCKSYRRVGVRLAWWGECARLQKNLYKQ